MKLKKGFKRSFTKRFKRPNKEERKAKAKDPDFLKLDNNDGKGPTLSSLLGQGWLAPIIISMLDATDATRFACASRDCRAIRLQTIDLQYNCCDLHGPSNIYYAKVWQSLPDFDQRPHTIFLRCLWKDQGWGNRKGMISIVANGGKAPNDYKPWSDLVMCGKEPAPHDLSPLSLSFHPTEETMKEAYKIWLRVGHGGGHRLEVEDLCVRVLSYC